jgi:arginyl-tRNA synthetase
MAASLSVAGAVSVVAPVPHSVGQSGSHSHTLYLSPCGGAGPAAGDGAVRAVAARGAALHVAAGRGWLLGRVLREVAAHGGPVLGAPLAGRVVAVEFSSPNVAKPFHVGHLRSTILGGYLARVHAAFGARVTAINYLGDWGKQFGLLGVGFAHSGNEAALAADPLRHLYDVYVDVNRAADADPAVHAAARAYAKDMAADPVKHALWTRFRELSVAAYVRVYERLGIHFDEYSGESRYVDASTAAMAELRAAGLLVTQSNGAEVADLTAHGLGKAVMVKEDGETLYLSRDVAAARERFSRLQFDRHFYVTGSEQALHFQQLFKLLELTGSTWANRLTHVGFGLIRGMRTRLGTAIFLEDLLDEARVRRLSRTAGQR